MDLQTGIVYSSRGTKKVLHVSEGSPEGHLFVRLYDGEGKRRFIAVHHVVWMAGTKIELPDKWHVHHLDKNPGNNSYENLIALHPDDHRKIHANEPVEEIPF